MTSQDQITRTIGNRVRSARAANGISRKRLAALADVSERYLNELENGDANASVGILARVAGALGVEVVSLLVPSPDGEAHNAPGCLHPPLAELIAAMSLREQEVAHGHLERFLADRRKSTKGIALLGLRGAGKTTIGAMLAERQGLPFLSVTREIEARAGMSLTDLFNLGGQEAYRALEHDVVTDLAGRCDRIVLETAGGIVSNAPALDVILGSFKTVWLKASPTEHLERVIGQGDMRPMQATPKALEHLKSLLGTREQEYARADCVLDTTGRTPEACVAELELITGTVAPP